MKQNEQLNMQMKDKNNLLEQMGEDRFATLAAALLKDGRQDDLARAVAGREYREKLYAEYQID